MTTTKHPIDLIKEVIPKHVSLFYLDRNDEYHNYEVIQSAMNTKSFDPIYEDLDSWIFDQQGYSMEYYKEELKKDLEKYHDMQEENLDEFLMQYEQDIEDILHSRDDSTPVHDVLSRIGAIATFYDTGYEMESESWSWNEKRVNQEVRDIKKHLGIKGKEHDNDLSMMIRQASYGGSLVVYFNPDVEDIIKSTGNMIRFTNPSIAIINIGNGSGDNCNLHGTTISLPFDSENIFVDKTIKYNYTHEVCGMYDDWCAGTGVEIYTKKTRKQTAKTNLNQLIDQDRKYKEVYEKGSCSTGDMDITRHRNKEYVNSFPCGTRCNDCNTFWID
jgi:hypothetical protein